jgi:hypothetical protein
VAAFSLWKKVPAQVETDVSAPVTAEGWRAAIDGAVRPVLSALRGLSNLRVKPSRRVPHADGGLITFSQMAAHGATSPFAAEWSKD